MAWSDIPGGHIEKDESLADSVIREVKEENGLNMPLYVYVFITRIPFSYGKCELSAVIASGVQYATATCDRATVAYLHFQVNCGRILP